MSDAAARDLKPGMALGPYKIERRLGAGGMGEVFCARDTRLDRPVAIKVSYSRFTDRFEREARAISALNHPNVCTLYDVGVNYLVMELIEGDTLAEKLLRGPLSIDQICLYGGQIAEALAAAHAKGIVHRDLKPGNIMLTKSGIKVLDFGLARGTAGETETQTLGVMGTPAYMSPEQRQGKICDHRTDIYALGLILREMATGSRDGRETGSGNSHLNRIIDRCLAEDPDDRWQTARDLKGVLELSRAVPSSQNLSQNPARTSSHRLRWLAAALVVAIAALMWASKPDWRPGWRERSAPAVVRLAVAIPDQGLVSDPGRLSGPPAISPDGKVVVMSLGVGPQAALWSRRLDSDRFDKLTGTEGASSQPFWSPDGAQIAFFAAGKLKKMRMPRGTPENICDTPTETARGGAWSSKGVILFGVNYKGLMKVAETGGEPILVAGLDGILKENSLRFPQFFSDGNRFLYFSRTLDARKHAVYIDALDTVGKTPRRKLVVSDGPSAIGHDPFTERDYLLFPNDGYLWAQALDQSSASLSGEKTAVSEDVGQFSLSTTGTLVFRRSGSENDRLQWVDRTGKPERDLGQPGDYWDLSLAPDERHAAVLNHRSADGRFWVEVIDAASNTQTPLSDPAGRAAGLVWAPDSASVYFTSWGDNPNTILVRRLDSAERPQVAYTLPERYDARSFTPDAKTLVADRWGGRGGNNRRGLVFSPSGSSAWKLFEDPSATFERAQFSPDGRWVAYEVREGAASAIFVTDFPGLATRKRVSPGGGTEPRWARDGKQLFYLADTGNLISVSISGSSALAFSPPETLFRAPGRVTDNGGFSYDVSREGNRFLVVNRTPPVDARDLSIIFNWPQLMAESGGK